MNPQEAWARMAGDRLEIERLERQLAEAHENYDKLVKKHKICIVCEGTGEVETGATIIGYTWRPQMRFCTVCYGTGVDDED